MDNGIRTGDPLGFSKGRCSNFCEDSRVQQTHKEAQRTYRRKTLNDKNYRASSQKSLMLF